LENGLESSHRCVKLRVLIHENPFLGRFFANF